MAEGIILPLGGFEDVSLIDRCGSGARVLPVLNSCLSELVASYTWTQARLTVFPGAVATNHFFESLSDSLQLGTGMQIPGCGSPRGV